MRQVSECVIGVFVYISVAQEVNLRYPLHTDNEVFKQEALKPRADIKTTKYSSKRSSLALTPRADITRSSKQAYKIKRKTINNFLLILLSNAFAGTTAVDSQKPGMATVELDMVFPEEEYLQMVEEYVRYSLFKIIFSPFQNMQMN